MSDILRRVVCVIQVMLEKVYFDKERLLIHERLNTVD